MTNAEMREAAARIVEGLASTFSAYNPKQVSASWATDGARRAAVAIRELPCAPDEAATISRLTAERDRMRKALDDIADMATDTRLVNRLKEIERMAEVAISPSLSGGEG